MQKKTKLILVVLLPIQILVLQLLKHIPEFIETFYSTGIFPFISKTSRYVFGWIPFSIGDVFYFFLILLLIRWIFKNIKRIKTDTKNFILDIFSTLSVVYLLFNLLWGLNYYRVPLHQSLSIDTEYNTEELITTTKRLIKKSNEMHRKLGFHDTVNSLIKLNKFPVVSCHEQAHQLGYAAENEANFIAVLATINNDDDFIQYTGYIFALRYCVNEIASRDLDTYRELLTTINPGILKSYKEMRDFWRSYENPFEVVSKLFWDQFLKANNQSNGIKSYNYMVALIINYYEDQQF